MPKATNEHTPYEGWPLGALEPVILDLQTTVAVFGHLINSPDEVDKNTWAKVETDLIVAAGQIRELGKGGGGEGERRRSGHDARPHRCRSESGGRARIRQTRSRRYQPRR